MEAFDPPAVPQHIPPTRILVSCAGAALALMMGLTAGHAMKPQLVTDHRPEGPQILTGGLAERATGPYDDYVSTAHYGGRLPDYVLGTDMNRQVSMAVPPPSAAEREPEVEPVVDTEPAAEEPARPIEVVRPDETQVRAEPVSYPSVDGGRPYPLEAQRRTSDDVPATQILAASDY